MNESVSEASYPPQYKAIDAETKQSGFTMASDVLTCGLLRTLAAAKPGGSFLELGTGTGLSTVWILNGMDSESTLVSIDNDAAFLGIARQHLGSDNRLQLVCTDGEAWIAANIGNRYDYIFADTWHGKYLLLDEILSLLNKGAFYIIDDMLPQPNWPDGHAEKAGKLMADLEARHDLVITKQHWASGIIVAVKK